MSTESGNGNRAALEKNEKALLSLADRIQGSLEKLTGGCNASSVFEVSERSAERVVITAASVQKAGGFGFGSGTTADEGSGGGGGGGGGNAEARPIAVIEVTQSGVNVKPVFDFTKIGLTILTGAFAIWRMSRKKR